VAWNGKNQAGQYLAPGAYKYQLAVQLVGRPGEKTFEGALQVDGASPVVSIAADPDLFSPDGDGYDDTMNFIPAIQDDCGVRSWVIRVKNTNDAVVKQIVGMGPPPARVVWDGRGDDGKVVPQANRYGYSIQVRDCCSNVSEAAGTVRIKTDYYVNKQADGSLMINLEGVEFDTAKYNIRTNSFEILDRAASILLRSYVLSMKVRVEGHTDSQGGYDYNIDLSKNRSKEVMKYLIGKGVAAERLSFAGFGPTKAIADNATVEGRQRNRRVELVLRKE